MNKKIIVLLIGLFLVINFLIVGCVKPRVTEEEGATEEGAEEGTGLEEDLKQVEEEEVGVEELDELDKELEEIESLDI